MMILQLLKGPRAQRKFEGYHSGNIQVTFTAKLLVLPRYFSCMGLEERHTEIENLIDVNF